MIKGFRMFYRKGGPRNAEPDYAAARETLNKSRPKKLDHKISNGKWNFLKTGSFLTPKRFWRGGNYHAAFVRTLQRGRLVAPGGHGIGGRSGLPAPGIIGSVRNLAGQVHRKPH